MCTLHPFQISISPSNVRVAGGNHWYHKTEVGCYDVLTGNVNTDYCYLLLSASAGRRNTRFCNTNKQLNECVLTADAAQRRRTTSLPMVKALHRGFGNGKRSSWRQSKNVQDPVPLTLDLLKPKSLGSDPVRMAAAEPSLK